MRPLRIPLSPAGSSGLPHVFRVGFCTVVRRAVVIGNGVAGAENQCVGLVRALGLSHRKTIYRVTRPGRGINEWLHCLRLSLHQKLDYVVKKFCGFPELRIVKAKKVMPLPDEEKGCIQSQVAYKKCISGHKLPALLENDVFIAFNECNPGLPGFLQADAKKIAEMARETFDKDGPLLVVASGRDTISASSTIKRLAQDNVFVVQIQHPRLQLHRFDLVIAPRHDYYPLSPEGQKQIPLLLRRWITPREPPDGHVVLTVGALHQADSAALQVAASIWHDELGLLPRPLLVVNIGGPTRHCQYDVDLAKQLIFALQNVLWSCGSLRISFSRRTPRKVSDIVVKKFANHPKANIWDGKDPNPHMGNLAFADAFVITADSVSMLSEACSTGKPVYVIGSERCTWKFADFHKSLLERGMVRPITGEEDISKSWSYPPLNDTAEAASRVIEALAERGWKLQP